MFGHLNHGKVEIDGAVTITTGEGAEIVEYTAKATIAAGQVVQMNLAGSGAARATEVIVGTATDLAGGIALEAATTGNPIRVCVGGYIEGVVATGAAGTTGDRLMVGAAGVVLKQAGSFAATGTIGGQCFATQFGTIATGKVSLYWYRRA